MTLEDDYITVYCPVCGRKVGKHHARSTINKYFTCKKCNKEVMFDCVKMETYVGKKRERKSNSGLVF